jgi:hypothetical protein
VILRLPALFLVAECNNTEVANVQENILLAILLA